MSMPEQYPCPKICKITRSEILSFRCVWEGVPTRKQQDLGIAKQYSLFGKLDSVKYTKEQHACVVMGELNDGSSSNLSFIVM